MSTLAPERWRVSLHGGHSGDFCEHATGSLRSIIEAAASAGYHTFGVSEHAPRVRDEFLYDEERELGWDVARLCTNFDRYAAEVSTLAEEYSERLCVLRGFEAEIVPADDYVRLMTELQRVHGFDYMVGSVHYVDEILIDGPPALYEQALTQQDGMENLCARYYELVAGMVAALRPAVVGHLDLVRKNAPSEESVDTPRIRGAADAALEAVREHECLLDLNTAGYRKGLGRPYPSPWLVQRAHAMGIGFCFGDDSHSPDQVGAGLDAGRAYLLELGVGEIEYLTKRDGALIRERVAL